MKFNSGETWNASESELKFNESFAYTAHSSDEETPRKSSLPFQLHSPQFPEPPIFLPFSH